MTTKKVEKIKKSKKWGLKKVEKVTKKYFGLEKFSRDIRGKIKKSKKVRSF